jgi:hypothetical protein
MCELPSCVTYAKPKARKRHKCCECGGLILEGETYVRVSGIWDGEPERFKTCIECEALRNEADKNSLDPDEMTPFGYLSETLSEMGDEELSKRFAEVKAKRKPAFANASEAAMWGAQFL